MKWNGPGGRVLVRVAAALVIAGAGVWVGASTHAQGSVPPQPGSPQDPLVSQSFVTAAVGRTAAHVLRLAGGQAWVPATGTAWALIGGTAMVTVNAAGIAGASGTAVPALVDLTAGSAQRTGAPSSVPPDHLLVTAASGVQVTAGSAGAVVWIAGSGGGHTVSGASLPGGG